jgi:hypothetical protein
MRYYIILCVAIALGGCATVTRGTETNVTFESSPSGAEVRTQLVDMCSISECRVDDAENPTAPAVHAAPPIPGPNCTTPCSIRVSRKQAIVATFTKAGYEPQTVNVQLRVAGAGAAGLAGNVLIGGVIGLGVDAISGAALEHFPNPVSVNLTAIPLPPPPPPVAQRRKR